jgi:hypothetical protein
MAISDHHLSLACDVAKAAIEHDRGTGFQVSNSATSVADFIETVARKIDELSNEKTKL